jgi:hypothetical protein
MRSIELAPKLAEIWDIQYSNEVEIDFVFSPMNAHHVRDCENYTQQEISVGGER